jgi:hypothetical protein
MAKKPYFGLFNASLRANAWRISWPHISTSENLHVNQKPVFSVVLRLLSIFGVSETLHFFGDEIWGRFFSQRVRFKQFAGRLEKPLLFSWSFQLWPCDGFSALLSGPSVQIWFCVLVQVAANRSKRIVRLRVCLSFVSSFVPVFSKLISKVSWKEDLTVNSLCLVDASVYGGAISYPHQVLLANFFWRERRFVLAAFGSSAYFGVAYVA